MADSTALDSFIAAQNFCTGSQTDYSTCIANNMRFTPFLTDTYKASSYAGLSTKTSDIPIVSGSAYVDLVPLAIANIYSRVMMTNSYGGVSFRCSEVFDRPRLPLPSLQDLGIPSQDILNVIGVDPEEPIDDGLYFEGIPISPGTELKDYMLNYLNLLIGYTTAVSDAMTKGRELKGVIVGFLDYYTLPSLSLEMQDLIDKSLLIHDEALRYLNLAYGNVSADNQLRDTVTIIKDLLASAESYTSVVRSQVTTDIVNPLSIIDENTDFGYFDFTITDAVVETISTQEADYYPFIFSYSMQAKSDSAIYGVPPAYPKDNILVNQYVVDIYGSGIRNLVSESLTLISKLYTVSSQESIDTVNAALRANETFFNSTVADSSFYITSPRNTIPNTNADDTEKYEEYHAVIDQLETLINTFSFDNIMNRVEAVYDPENYESLELVQAELDDYYETTGNDSSIQLYNLTTKQQELYNTTIDDKLTVINLGGDYKDAGNFYYADLAFAVGYTKLSNITSIQIDDEFYSLTDIVDENGNPIGGISETGCTKYTFTRHVLPTYDVEIEMYIYPGTPDQPYCPTINKYHNFLTSKYYGMFTKQDGEDMGVYVYRGYKPMQGTVEEVINIGTMDLNSVNLNDPSLDQQSYEAMLMKEVKNLTNSSSINGEPMSTEDLKYYLASELVDDTVAQNYPGLAIIEFKLFPMGSTTKFPSVKVHVTGEDLI